MVYFGDLFGCKCMFILSIFMMVVLILIMGLFLIYVQIGIWVFLVLFLLRVIQGVVIGGEVLGVWVFVVEYVLVWYVGYVCGMLIFGLMVGILLGLLVVIVINSFYSVIEVQDYVWWIFFLFGGVFGLFLVYLCCWLYEMLVFVELQQCKVLVEEVLLKVVVCDYCGVVLVLMLLIWVLLVVIVVVILMIFIVLQSVYGFDVVMVFKVNSLVIVCLIFGCIVVGCMVDCYGVGLIFVVGSVLLVLVFWSFYGNFKVYLDWFFFLYVLIGFFVGIVGVVFYVMVNVFLLVVCFFGLFFFYNLVYVIFGGLMLMVVVLLFKQSLMGLVYYVVILCLVGFFVGFYLLVQKKLVGEVVLVG